MSEPQDKRHELQARCRKTSFDGKPSANANAATGRAERKDGWMSRPYLPTLANVSKPGIPHGWPQKNGSDAERRRMDGRSRPLKRLIHQNLAKINAFAIAAHSMK
jgi:hypothetical protein